MPKYFPKREEKSYGAKQSRHDILKKLRESEAREVQLLKQVEQLTWRAQQNLQMAETAQQKNEMLYVKNEMLKEEINELNKVLDTYRNPPEPTTPRPAKKFKVITHGKR